MQIAPTAQQQRPASAIFSLFDELNISLCKQKRISDERKKAEKVCSALPKTEWEVQRQKTIPKLKYEIIISILNGFLLLFQFIIILQFFFLFHLQSVRALPNIEVKYARIFFFSLEKHSSHPMHANIKWKFLFSFQFSFFLERIMRLLRRVMPGGGMWNKFHDEKDGKFLAKFAKIRNESYSHFHFRFARFFSVSQKSIIKCVLWEVEWVSICIQRKILVIPRVCESGNIRELQLARTQLNNSLDFDSVEHAKRKIRNFIPTEKKHWHKKELSSKLAEMNSYTEKSKYAFAESVRT